MTNPFLSNNFTDRAKFLKDYANRPDIIDQAVKDAGLETVYQIHPGINAAVIPKGHSWSPVSLDEAIAAQITARNLTRKPIKWQQLRTLVHHDKDWNIPGACDCKIGGAHESWCDKWKAYEAE
jgi:hypothetical protein